MIKKLTLLFCLAVGAFAQGTTSAVPLPGSWVGVGMGYSRDASPQSNGWVSYAKLVSPTQAAYSYSSYDVVRVGNSVTASLRTGAAVVLRQQTFGKATITILGFGQAGIATGAALTSSFAGGGFGVVRFGQSRNTLEGGLRIQKMGSVDVKVYEVGVGRTF